MILKAYLKRGYDLKYFTEQNVDFLSFLACSMTKQSEIDIKGLAKCSYCQMSKSSIISNKKIELFRNCNKIK